MFRSFWPVTLLCWGLCAAALLGMTGACSLKYHKAEADREVYKIIDSKWQDSFGQKVNYTISDAPPSPNDIKIEKAVPPSGVITLAQAVAMATAHNREYQRQKESLYLSALSLTLTRHKYARQWFGTIDGKYVKDVDNTGNNYEDVSVGTGEKGAGLEQMQLLGDGVLVTTSLAIDWIRFLAGDPRTSLRSVLSSSVAVPLLGAGAGKVAREELTQAERNVFYDIRSFNRHRKTFVVSIVNDYYRVLQRRDEVTNAENDYIRRVESKERLDMEAEAGRVPPFQVDQAETDVLRAQDSYVRAQQTYEQRLDQFKITLSLPTDANIVLDQNELKALEKIGVSELDYIPEAAIETALLRRLDLANSADWIDDALRGVLLAADGLGPQLNLTGGLNVSSREETDFTQLQFHQGSYTAGFNTDLPLDRKAQRNAYRQALIALEQRQREYESDMDNIKLEVRSRYRQLREAAERYQIQKNNLEVAKRRVESTKLLSAAGRVDALDLLLAQDALLEAQNNVTAALVDHLVAKLSFYRDVGILQVRPDGMWQ